MKKVDFLIIGGGAAGTTAAETLRQNNKDGSITIVSDEPYRFYSRILISKPNFFLEKTPFEQVWLKTEAWYSENRIELLTGRSAIKLDTKNKIVSLNDGAEIGYGKLLLAVGGHARRWTVPGADKKGVGYLRNLEEALAMIKNVKTAKRAIAIGSGFVSFEIAEIMRKAGLEVSIVMLEPYYWYPVFDEESGKFIEKAMEKEGVKMIHKSEVAEVLGGERVKGVILKDGTKIDCDVIACGIGLNYDLGWVKEAGIETGRGIMANEFLQTNNSDIFTAGDCAEYNDLIIKERLQLANWVNAQSQGTTAALNMLGKKQEFKLVSFYTAQAFGVNISMVGDIKTGEGKTVISRGTPEANSFGKIIIKDGRILGATLLNRTPELFQISKLIELGTNISGQEKDLADPSFNLTTLINKPMTEVKKIKVAWFCFSCCEDSLVVFTELMNDHWQEWKKLFDFRHVRALRTGNQFDEFDVAFIEGALASQKHVDKVKEIRAKAKKVVAVGSCAVTGMPAGQRNYFDENQKKNIQFLVDKFEALPKVLKVSEVIHVDAEVGGCPMDPNKFLETVNKLLKP